MGFKHYIHFPITSRQPTNILSLAIQSYPKDTRQLCGKGSKLLKNLDRLGIPRMETKSASQASKASAMFTKFFKPELDYGKTNDMSFKQYGATCLTVYATLAERFDGMVISHRISE